MRTKFSPRAGRILLLLLLSALFATTTYAGDQDGSDKDNPRWQKAGTTVTWDTTKCAFKIRMPFYFDWATTNTDGALRHYQAQATTDVWIQDPSSGAYVKAFTVAPLNNSNGCQDNFLRNNTFNASIAAVSTLAADTWGVIAPTGYGRVTPGNTIGITGSTENPDPTICYAYSEIYWYPPVRFINSQNVSFQMDRVLSTYPVYSNSTMGPVFQNPTFSLTYKISIVNPTHQPTLSSYTYGKDGDGNDGSLSINYTVPKYSYDGDCGGSAAAEYERGKLELRSSTASTVSNPTNANTAYIMNKVKDSGGTITVTNKDNTIAAIFVNGGSLYLKNWRLGHWGNTIKNNEYSRFSNAITIDAYHQVTALEANMSSNESQIELQWKVTQAPVGPKSPTCGFTLQYHNGDNVWQEIPTPAWNTANATKDAYYSISIALPDIQKGDKTYTFRIKREYMNWGVYDKTTKLTVNTDPKKISTGKVAADPNGASLTWSLSSSGVWNSNWKYELIRNGVVDASATIANNGLKYIDDISSCTKTSYVLKLKDGNTDLWTYDFGSITVNRDNPGIIASLKASKGFYRDRVILEWAIDPNNTNFTYYVVKRKPVGDENTSYSQVTQFDHNPNQTLYKYEDLSVSPGEYYEYLIEGWSACDQTSTLNSQMKEIGFAQPLGVLNGRVTYSGGTVVEGVEVMALGDDLFKNQALSLSGANDFVETQTDGSFFNQDEFTFQAWVRISENAGKQMNLYGLDGYHNFYITNTRTLRLNYLSADVNFDSIMPVGEFKHITLVVKRNNAAKTGTASLYIDGAFKEEKDFSFSTNFPANSTTRDKSIFIGSDKNNNSLKGNLDEVRFWDVALDSSEIKNNYSRYISGKENGLFLYYRFDETGSISQVFDMSATGKIYNEHHGTLRNGAKRSSEVYDVPSSTQLSIKGVTDKYGNYIINTIPYADDGSQYRIRPVLGVHSFDPEEKSLFFSNISSSYNVDFTDISTFKVGGTVTYEGGTYPVKGCSFMVDGKTQLDMYGSTIESDDAGDFTIEVPIGKHEIKIAKSGHTFLEDGIYVANFQDEVVNLKFTDQTKVKVIGRVVGGQVESKKPLGFGENINNLGVDTLVFETTMSQYTLDTVQVDETILHNSGEWRKRTGLQQDTTHTILKGNKVKVAVSPVTGEFVANLYPVVYNLGDILPYGYSLPSIFGSEQIDLTNTPTPSKDLMQYNVRTWTDSTLVPADGAREAYYEKKDNSDTVRYHRVIDKIYNTTAPNIEIVQKSGDNALSYWGDTLTVISNPIQGTKDTIALALPDGKGGYKYLFDGLPVFTQGTNYNFGLKFFESYENKKTGVIDTIPVADVVATITNGLDAAAAGGTISVDLDSLGVGTYTFMAGNPDLTTGIRQFSALFYINDRQYNWTYGDKNKASVLQAYLLGGQMTGTDFMTAGPDEITAVVHDPPGTNSYAYFEKGTTIKKTTSFNVADNVNLSASAKISLGPEVTTFIGLGGGVIIQAKATADLETKTQMTQSYKYDNTSEEVTTFTERFETSSDPLYVGQSGDLFIGNSTNIQYGYTNNISIKKENAIGSEETKIGTKSTDDGYIIAKTKGLTLGQTFKTRFLYTEVELETIMIPKWVQNRNLMLQPTAIGDTIDVEKILYPVYVSKLPPSDSNFGQPNISKVFGTKASTGDNYFDGPSYKIYFPKDYEMSKLNPETGMYETFVDSVMWYNNQIEGWTKVLADNEKEQVDMELIGNYSFGSGGSVEWSNKKDATTTQTHEFNFVLTVDAKATVGAEVSGIGLSATLENETALSSGGSVGSEESTSKTVGFKLQENGDDDEISVDYGWTKSGTVAFKSRGGRTSCPYEGERKTRYYEPGRYTLGEGTMQIEVPKIEIVGSPSVLRVPENRPATFTLSLRNESETDEDVYFKLFLEENTNPYGAQLKIDGASLGSGRRFLVPAGEALTKTLTVEKGPNEDFYENLKLRLASECQYDPTDFADDIYDETTFSVQFLPSCSDVSFAAPINNWVVNCETKNKTMDVLLEGYDVNYSNFGHVDLQYKAAASSEWISLKQFYANEDRYNASSATNKQLLSTTDNSIAYQWDMSNLPDGNYELRARSICETFDIKTGAAIQVSESTTPSVVGLKDMVRPTVFGKAQPADGILRGTNDLMVQFNELINEGLVTVNNFSVMGVKNGSTTAHTTAVHLDGDNDYIAGEQEIALENKSYTIGFWLKRNKLGAATILAHGTPDNALTMSFAADNTVQVAVGGGSPVTSKNAITDTENWAYYVLVYDADASTVSVYYAMGAQTLTLIDTKPAGTYNGLGTITVGRTASGTNYGAFDIHGLRLWDGAQTRAEALADINTILSGTEMGLIAYWPMDEGKGTLLKEKTRSRHAVTNGSWANNPPTKAAAFNGTDSYVDINTASTVVIGKETDFSIEMWFKGGGTDGTLFSCGRGDGTTNESIDDKLSIYFDNGNLVVASKGKTNQVSSTNYLDNQWHHFVLSVSRAGTSNVYIDGNLVTYYNNSTIGTMSREKMTIGAMKWTEKDNLTVEKTGKYFKGIIDEFRIWKMALNSDFIDMFGNVRLTGNEAGLVAYYPFESYATDPFGQKKLSFDSKDLSALALSSDAPDAPDAYKISESDETAPIKDAGPIDSYAFSVTTNGDKAILTLKESIEKIENTHITVSVSGIQDLNGNNMDGAFNWNAYIDRAFLKWMEPSVSKTKKNDEDLTFTVSIVNTGGAAEPFTVENIPSWLEVTPSSGTVSPSSTAELTFTVNPGLNTGLYEEMLYLKGNYTNAMVLKLNVGNQKPEWSVDPGKYDASMSIIGQLKINGVISTDKEDIIGAFVGNECVGVASPQYNKNQDLWLTMLNVYNNTSRQPVEFRIWDASTGRTYANALPNNMVFEANSVKGTPTQPVVFETTDEVLQTIDLKPGWNWISFNTATSGMNDVNNFFRGITTGEEVKSQAVNAFSRYDATSAYWLNGTLNGAGLNNKEMYMVKMTNKENLYVSGTPLSPSQTTITLKSGWNWISFIPQVNMTLAEAFSGMAPNAGDVVKGISSFAMYDENFGWVGSLEYMRPNNGYMYKTAKTASFNYPENTTLRSSSLLRSSVAESSDFEYNMPLIARIDPAIAADGAQLVTKVDQTLRSMSDPIMVDNEALYFVSIPAGQEGGLVSFELLNVNGETMKLNECLRFGKDDVVGTVNNPFLLTAEGDNTLVFPNPVNETLFVRINSAEGKAVVSMYDVANRLLLKTDYNIVSSTVSLKELNVGSLQPGTYLLQVQVNDRIETFKVIKQ